MIGPIPFADKELSTGVKLAGLGYMACLGAAIGVGIDALIPHKAVIFRGGTRTPGTLHFAPILTRSSRGASVSLKF